MRRAFTLIELLVIVAILATMTTIGVGSLRSGQAAARVKGATRDVYAAIRHARSLALVTGQRVKVTYSNETVDDENAIRIAVEPSRKIMSVDTDSRKVQRYHVLDYKDMPQPVLASEQTVAGTAAGSEGESIDEVLFAPPDARVVGGMCIKVVKGENLNLEETAVQRRYRISVASNAGGGFRSYDASKGAETDAKPADEAAGSASDADVMREKVEVLWETNGAVEPHQVWVYASGKRPESGLLLRIDRFGAVKVLRGDGQEDRE